MKELGGISIASQYILLVKQKMGQNILYMKKTTPRPYKKNIDLISKENIYK